MGLFSSNDWHSYHYKKGNLDTVSTGRRKGEDEVREQGDTSTNQGKPRMASRSPEARRAAWSRLSSSLRRNEPCPHFDLGLDLGLPASRALGQ